VVSTTAGKQPWSNLAAGGGEVGVYGISGLLSDLEPNWLTGLALLSGRPLN
jgi:hypothetical protein